MDRAQKDLLKAADLIEKHGWTQTIMGSTSTGFCAIGAMRKAVTVNVPRSRNLNVALLLAGHLAEKDGRPVRRRVDSNDLIDALIYIETWNDDCRQTAKEVVATMRAAAGAED